MKRITVVVMLLAVILGLSACAQSNTDSLREEDIRAICELATLECYYNNVAKIEKKADMIFQTDRKMWIEYEGKAVIGIDMSGVVIEITGEIINITMPKAEILSIDYEFDADSYISSADGWLVKNEITTQEQQDAVVAAQEEMRQAISSNKALFLKAEDRAKELIENYINKISGIIGKEYTINWRN